MSFLNTYALWFLMALPPVIILYLLKVKRDEKEISSTLLWEQVINDLAANTPFQRLRKNLLMFLQLLLLTAIVFSLLRPIVKGVSTPTSSTVIIIDNSGSMNALENGKSRFDIAKAEARKLITGSSLSKANEFMVLTAGRDVATISSFTADIFALENKISSIEGTDLTDNAKDAMLVAASAIKDRPDAFVYFITDGCLKNTAINVPALKNKLRIIQVGEPQPNIALINLAAESLGEEGAYEVFFSVKNFSDKDRSTIVTIYDGDSPVNVEEIVLPAFESKSRSFTMRPNSEIIKCEIDSDDAIKDDNQASYIVSKKKDIPVLIVTSGNVFLIKAISSLNGTTVTTIEPSKYTASTPNEFDVVIYDGFTPEKIPLKKCIFLSPSSDVGSVKLGGSIESVIVTDYDKEDPLLRFVALRDLFIGEMAKIQNPEFLHAIASSKGVPVIGYFAVDDIQHLLIAFDLSKSDWAVRPSFPIFISNLIESTASANRTIASVNLPVGSVIEINKKGEKEKVVITRPDGKSEELTSESTVLRYFGAVRAGLYQIKISDNKRLVAMNFFDDIESDSFRRRDLAEENPQGTVATSIRSVNREIWKYFAIGAFVIGMAEWICFHRKIQ